MEINRSELITQMVKTYGYTKKSATESVDDTLNMILENLRNGNSVSIYGFGQFDLVQRAAHRCVNPYNGEDMVVPEHSAVRFTPGQRMKTAVKLYDDDVERGLM